MTYVHSLRHPSPKISHHQSAATPPRPSTSHTFTHPPVITSSPTTPQPCDGAEGSTDDQTSSSPPHNVLLTNDFIQNTLPLSRAQTAEPHRRSYHVSSMGEVANDDANERGESSSPEHGQEQKQGEEEQQRDISNQRLQFTRHLRMNRPQSQISTRRILASSANLCHELTLLRSSKVPAIRPCSGLLYEDLVALPSPTKEEGEKESIDKNKMAMMMKMNSNSNTNNNNNKPPRHSFTPSPTKTTYSSSMTAADRKEAWERLRAKVPRATYVSLPLPTEVQYAEFYKESSGGPVSIQTKQLLQLENQQQHQQSNEKRVLLEEVAITTLDTRPASRGLAVVIAERASQQVPKNYLAPGPLPEDPFIRSRGPLQPDPSLVRRPVTVSLFLENEAQSFKCTNANNPMKFVRTLQAKNSLSSDLIPPPDHSFAREQSRKNKLINATFRSIDNRIGRGHASPMISKLRHKVALGRTPTQDVQRALDESMEVKAELVRLRHRGVTDNLSMHSSMASRPTQSPRTHKLASKKNSSSSLASSTMTPRGAQGMTDTVNPILARRRTGIVKKQLIHPFQ
eukprot:PhM_4_TR418/c0_g1_i1/m.23545